MVKSPCDYTPEEQEQQNTEAYNYYKNFAYWSIYEGVRLLLPFLYRTTNFPIQVVIGDMFEKIKRDVETQKFKAINTGDEIKEILNFDPKAEWEKFCQEHPSDKPRRNLTLTEIQIEKENFFYKNIKIEPGIFIRYIKAHLDRFSEIEIPPELEELLVENPSSSESNKPEPQIPLEERLNALINKVAPEINRLYEEIKSIAKADGRDTQALTYNDGIEAFKQTKDSFKILKQEHMKDQIFGTEKPYRDVKGQILKEIVKDQIPELIGNKEGIKMNAQELHNRMKRLETT